MRAADDLERFVEAQDPVYASVCAELRSGRKSTHWMWFVFPQLRGLGRSDASRYYGLGSRAEAAAYLAHPLLGARLRETTRLALAADTESATELFGSPDDLKFRSSMTLFAEVARGEPLFREALEKYFGGVADARTRQLLDPP